MRAPYQILFDFIDQNVPLKYRDSASYYTLGALAYYATPEQVERIIQDLAIKFHLRFPTPNHCPSNRV